MFVKLVCYHFRVVDGVLPLCFGRPGWFSTHDILHSSGTLKTGLRVSWCALFRVSLSLTLQPVMCICADMLGTSLIKKLLSGTLVFLSSKNKEVVRSTLVLVKITIRVLPPNELAPHVEDMVSFPLPSLPPSLSSFFTSISSPLSPLLGEEHFELGWR